MFRFLLSKNQSYLLKSQKLSTAVRAMSSTAEQDKFLEDVFEMCMTRSVKAGRDRSNPVIKFSKPDELRRKFDVGLGKSAASNDELLQLCEKVIDNSVLTGHPRFFNQQIAGLNPYGFAGNVITDAMNVNGHTYEIAPAFTLIELEVINHMIKFIGYPNGEGTFSPGGSYSNLLAMNVARIWRFPESKASGISGLPPLVSFCSEQAHYSAKKNATALGFGADNCQAVECDSRGKMIPERLDERMTLAKEKGAVPFFVTATAATTVLGAFDDFHKIADICEKHGAWLHVDGAWGGSSLLSPKYKHLCNGVERSDSMAWNPHKLMCAPVQTSLLFLREKGSLEKTYSIDVPYLFQNDKPYDVNYDLGRNLLQCGRRCDAFKLWLMWKAKGDEGFAKQIEKAVDNAQYLVAAVKKHPHFRLVNEESEFTNVSFWYIPPSLRGQKEDMALFKKCSEIIPTVKNRMWKNGSLMVGYTYIKDIPTFFRMVVVNETVEHQDMDFVLAEIERNAQDL